MSDAENGSARPATVDLEGLLKTKQSSRDKDKLDRAVLERALADLGKNPG